VATPLSPAPSRRRAPARCAYRARWSNSKSEPGGGSSKLSHGMVPKASWRKAQKHATYHRDCSVADHRFGLLHGPPSGPPGGRARMPRRRLFARQPGVRQLRAPARAVSPTDRSPIGCACLGRQRRRPPQDARAGPVLACWRAAGGLRWASSQNPGAVNYAAPGEPAGLASQGAAIRGFAKPGDQHPTGLANVARLRNVAAIPLRSGADHD
jgi:hypothetical protein